MRLDFIGGTEEMRTCYIYVKENEPSIIIRTVEIKSRGLEYELAKGEGKREKAKGIKGKG